MTGPAQILISRSFRDAIAADPGFCCIAKGVVEVKGKAEKEEIFELIWCGTPASEDSNARSQPALESTEEVVVSASVVELAAAKPRVGTLFAGRYGIERELGHGGFGTVYAAFDRSPLQRTVALKVINLTSFESSEKTLFARQRFLDEAKLAGALSHGNVATIFEAGESSGLVYLTQELAAGRDLRKILEKSGPLPLRRVIAL